MTMKDWSGTATSIFATHGASNHSEGERATYDYYATDPEAVRKLCAVETFSREILEPCCGGGHISETLKEYGYNVESWDVVKRSYAGQSEQHDFLLWNPDASIQRDIVTNPPYNRAMEFVYHAVECVAHGQRVAMFLKLTFLEGAKRKKLFSKYPPKTVYVFRSRIDCWKNGVKPEKASKAVCYAWFVWEKGFHGAPEIKWID